MTSTPIWSARLFGLGAAITIGLTACQPKVPDMTSEETQAITSLTQRMTTRCVGRYLIDLPEGFVLNSQSRTEVEGVKIKAVPMLQQQFDIKIDLLKKQYESKHLPLNNYPYLRDTYLLDVPNVGVVFDRNETSVTQMRAGRILELHGWREGFSFELTIEATDGTFPELQNDSYWKAQGSDVSQKMEHLIFIYGKVRGRKDNEIPDESGLCFANGFLKGPATDHEWVDMYHHLKDSRDVAFTYHHLTDLQQETDLLERSAGIEKMLANTDGRTLRKGKAQAQLPAAQEWLMSQVAQPGNRRYQHFTLEANAKNSGPRTPLFIADFDVGLLIPGPALTLEQAAVAKPLEKSTFSEAQTLAIWDKVIPTLRPRPGAF